MIQPAEANRRRCSSAPCAVAPPPAETASPSATLWFASASKPFPLWGRSVPALGWSLNQGAGAREKAGGRGQRLFVRVWGVMAGLVPAIHVFAGRKDGGGARHKGGDDAVRSWF